MYLTFDFTSFDHVFAQSTDAIEERAKSVVYQPDLNDNRLQKEKEL